MAKSELNRFAALAGRWRPAGVPVLLYHGIAGPGTGPIPARERKFWITDTQFIQQLQSIRSGGYQIAPLSKIWRLPGVAAHAPHLAITFDDGHATDYTVAFPLLCEFGLRADFFINTATVGSPEHLTWEQIIEMHLAGMSFQSHSHHHADLSRMPLTRLRGQLGYSKQLIEGRLGTQVEFLSVPYGLLNKRVCSVAREEGYHAVCTSRNWPSRVDERLIGRVPIQANTTRHEFDGLLARDLSPYATRMAREALLYWPKQILLRLHPAMLTVQALGEQE